MTGISPGGGEEDQPGAAAGDDAEAAATPSGEEAETQAAGEEAETQAAGAHVNPQSRLDKILAVVPRALSSHAHIIFLGALGVYLVLLPLVGVNVSARAELIGGNYTNVTSDLGACIAAGLTVHLVRRDRRRARELAEFASRVHARHDAFAKQLEEMTEAAKRAEQAAIRAGQP